jgi:hypothetical protein
MADIIVHRESPSVYAARVVWTIMGIVEGILGLQFILRLIGANPAAGFTNFIYSLAHPLLVPFFNVVRNTSTGSNGGVFEWTTLIAMVVYWLLAWAIIRLFFLNDSTDHVDYVEPM